VSGRPLSSTFAIFQVFFLTADLKKTDFPVLSLVLTTVRNGKESDMFRIPKAAEPLISAFSLAFTRPTFNRAVVLTLGEILSLRQRTVTGMLRAVGPLAQGHWSDFHRVLCRRVWSV
jgi:hypothetical protein